MGSEEFPFCLGCGIETTKKRRRLLSNDCDSITIWTLLRRHYSVLLAQKGVRIAADHINHKLTASDARNSDPVALKAYMCESCWKILCNFSKKEASIKKSIHQALSLLPTVQELFTESTINNDRNCDSENLLVDQSNFSAISPVSP